MKTNIKKFNDFKINEADTNKDILQNTANIYNKYKSKIVSMFSNIKEENLSKVSEDFEKFISSLPEAEKNASDLLRTLFSAEKMKYEIKSLETRKKDIDLQIQQRVKDLKQISDNLN